MWTNLNWHLLVVPGYLVGAGEAQPVEDGQEEQGCEQGVDALPETHVEELIAIAHGLRGHPQHLHRRHEAGTEGQPHRDGRHFPAPGEEIVSCGFCLSLLQGLEEPYHHGDKQHDGEHGVVRNAEPGSRRVLLSHGDEVRSTRGRVYSAVPCGIQAQS